MRWLAPCPLLVACAPPPAVAFDTGSEPPEAAIQIVYPPDQAQVQLTSTCSLKIDIAVDIDFFKLVEPGSAPAEGQGHWHLAVREDGSYIPVWNQYASINEPGFEPGTLLRPRVSLQGSDHADLDQFPQWEDQVEIFLVDDPVTPCVPPS
jgi:hypothetical protein